jgi:hypothetical protein
MTVLVTLTLAGADTGPFNLYSNSDGFVNAIATGVAKAALEAGYSLTGVPDDATIIRANSTGTCTNYLDMYLIGGTTTTTTSTTSTTTTSIPCVTSVSFEVDIDGNVDYINCCGENAGGFFGTGPKTINDCLRVNSLTTPPGGAEISSIVYGSTPCNCVPVECYAYEVCAEDGSGDRGETYPFTYITCNGISREIDLANTRCIEFCAQRDSVTSPSEFIFITEIGPCP